MCHGDSPARGGGSLMRQPLFSASLLLCYYEEKESSPLHLLPKPERLVYKNRGGSGCGPKGDVDLHPCTPLCSPVTVELSECRSCWQCQGWTWPSTLCTCDASLVAVTTRVQFATSLSLISSNGPHHSCHSLICLPPSSGSALSRSILTHSFSLSHPHA